MKQTQYLILESQSSSQNHMGAEDSRQDFRAVGRPRRERRQPAAELRGTSRRSNQIRDRDGESDPTEPVRHLATTFADSVSLKAQQKCAGVHEAVALTQELAVRRRWRIVSRGDTHT